MATQRGQVKPFILIYLSNYARMAKSADAADLKSAGRKAVGVQVPLRAPHKIKGLRANQAVETPSYGECGRPHAVKDLKGNFCPDCQHPIDEQVKKDCDRAFVIKNLLEIVPSLQRHHTCRWANLPAVSARAGRR